MHQPLIFISYRRDDCSGYAGRLEDALEQTFGAGCVFRDVRDIQAGESFADVIESSLEQAHVVLVLIGTRWLGHLDNGQRRIDDAQDFVRLEVATALTSHCKVIPVLLDGAKLPSAAELPESLRALTQRQALSLNDSSWEADLQRLTQSLDLPLVRRRRYWIAAACALLLAIAIPTYLHQQSVQRAAKIDAATRQKAQTENQFVGIWQAQVRYAWGDAYAETFELKRFANELTGTATFLKYPRGIQDLHVDGNSLRFITHSVETVNDKERELTHSYVAEFDGAQLHMRLHTTGGYTSNPPQEFTAVRTALSPPFQGEG